MNIYKDDVVTRRKLTRDAINPKPDGRKRETLQQQVVPAGTHILHVYRKTKVSWSKKELVEEIIYLHPSSYKHRRDQYEYAHANKNPAWLCELMEASEVVEKDIKDWVRDSGVDLKAVLESLIKDGVVSREKVLETQAQIDKEYEEKEAKNEAKH